MHFTTGEEKLVAHGYKLWVWNCYVSTRGGSAARSYWEIYRRPSNQPIPNRRTLNGQCTSTLKEGNETKSCGSIWTVLGISTRQPHLSCIRHKEQCRLYRPFFLRRGRGLSREEITNRSERPLCFCCNLLISFSDSKKSIKILNSICIHTSLKLPQHTGKDMKMRTYR